MAAPGPFVQDEEGFWHTDGLHLDGFTVLVWDVLRAAGYTTPPDYAARQFVLTGVSSCFVRVTVLPHPTRPEWPLLDLDATGSSYPDTLEFAAMRLMMAFCEYHPELVVLEPIGLFPATDLGDLLWRDRLSFMDATVSLSGALVTAELQSRCVIALYRLQYFLQEALRRSALESTVYYSALQELQGDYADLQGVYTDLQGGYTDLTMELADADLEREQMRVRIEELEGELGEAQFQVEDRQALLETIVDLEETVGEQAEAIEELNDVQHDMQLDLDAAHQLIHVLQQAPEPEPMEVDPPVVEQEQEEIEVDPSMVQGVSGVDTGAGPSTPAVPASPVESFSSVNNLDDF